MSSEFQLLGWSWSFLCWQGWIHINHESTEWLLQKMKLPQIDQSFQVGEESVKKTTTMPSWGSNSKIANGFIHHEKLKMPHGELYYLQLFTLIVSYGYPMTHHHVSAIVISPHGQVSFACPAILQCQAGKFFDQPVLIWSVKMFEGYPPVLFYILLIWYINCYIIFWHMLH